MASAVQPILQELDRIIEENAARLEVRTLCEVVDGSQRFPLRSLRLGSASREAPPAGEERARHERGGMADWFGEIA